MGDPVGAREVAERAVASAPDAAAPLVALSIALRRGGVMDDAVQAARAALGRDPFDLSAHHALLVALADARDHVAAREAGRRLFHLAPEDPTTHLNVGYALHRKWPELARGAYERCLQLDPTNAMARQNLAALDSKGRTFDAMEGFADALTLDPTSEVARSNLSQVVTRWALWMLAILVVLLQLVLRGSDGSIGARLVVALAVFALIVGAGLWLMPSSVRRALPTLLGVGRNWRRSSRRR